MKRVESRKYKALPFCRRNALNLGEMVPHSQRPQSCCSFLWEASLQNGGSQRWTLPFCRRNTLNLGEMVPHSQRPQSCCSFLWEASLQNGGSQRWTLPFCRRNTLNLGCLTHNVHNPAAFFLGKPLYKMVVHSGHNPVVNIPPGNPQLPSAAR